MKTFSRWRITVAAAAFSVGLLLLAFYTGLAHDQRPMELRPVISERNNTFSFSRRLLHRAAMDQPNRIWGDKCSKSEIEVNQGPTAPMPNGIPTYTVEIMNVCVTGCDISGIHLSCGWFSSARLINPKVFKRLRFNDCLVNDGKPLANGVSISFQYANTFSYPLSVSSVIC
ncbi:hypothetical protein HHK36_025219 [Tetracentron sinense]|uniref:Uncharacterized protein n=1 Tax=Tetracentron sinense TaxID=13715 RepID=A0A835D7H2_TETSI|nr:hypothetical protein HHK36_025219 [Tetracentron sinense]